MPEYEPTVWVNETPQTTPIKYKITDDSAGVVAASAKIELVTPVTPGTPVDATRLNKIVSIHAPRAGERHRNIW